MLASYVQRLLNNYLPDGLNYNEPKLDAINFALNRVFFSFKKTKAKYYSDKSEPKFDHLNSDHMVTFLYFLSRYYFEVVNNTAMASKLFYLNKIMNGIDLFYSVKMPQIFIVVHPVGTVIGHSEFQNYLAIWHNVTIGAEKNIYPKFGEGVVLYSGSRVIGDCKIGNNVYIGPNSLIVNTDVPNNSIVVGQYPNHRILNSKRFVKEQIFGIN